MDLLLKYHIPPAAVLVGVEAAAAVGPPRQGRTLAPRSGSYNGNINDNRPSAWSGYLRRLC
jgi:hypothetical protein